MNARLQRTRVRHRPEIVSAQLDGCIVLFNERTGRVRSLNATGSVVWQQLDGTCTLAELATAIADELGVEPAVAQAQVGDFVDDLLQHRFVVRVR